MKIKLGMLKSKMRYTPTQIQQWDVQVGTDDGNWIPARTVNHRFESWINRIKNAIGVLTGRYDVLDWEEPV